MSNWDRTESVHCMECDHEHLCPVNQDEHGDDVEVPDACEGCGAPMFDGPVIDEQKAERQQMGIT